MVVLLEADFFLPLDLDLDLREELLLELRLVPVRLARVAT